MFEWISQVFVALFVGWFWVLTTIFFASFTVAFMLNNEQSPKVLFIGGLIFATVAVSGSFMQLKGYYAVNDLRKQFEGAVAATDAAGNSNSNIDKNKLVLERNLRLAKIGYCPRGGWYETKNSGKPPNADTGWITYEWCGHYGS